MIKKYLRLFLITFFIINILNPQKTFAINEATRTIMVYICGADLESFSENATLNIKQILNANFSKDEKVRVVVMTGGSYEWWLDSEYLIDPQNPDRQLEVSIEYNQIWEAKGADSEEFNINGHGRLVLVDEDGVSGDGVNAKTSYEELMIDPSTLKKFINYTVQNFPAQEYGLILWDHGGGPLGGFGIDEHMYNLDVDDPFKSMSFSELIDALSDNDVIRTRGKFDFINFDACLMNSVELNLALVGYTKYYIASAETEPGDGQFYTGWLDALGNDPNINTFELGKIFVDDFIRYYEEEGEDDVTLAVVDLQRLMDAFFLTNLNQMNEILKREIHTRGVDGAFLYYDELGSANNSIYYAVGDKSLKDIGSFAGQLPIRIKEVNADSIDEHGLYTLLNDYKEPSQKIIRTLINDAIIYNRAIGDSSKTPLTYIDDKGEIQYGIYNSTGMHIFFPELNGTAQAVEYRDTILGTLPLIQDDEIKEFLRSYVETIIDYTLLIESGNAVAELINKGVQKNEINFNKIKEYWKGLTTLNGNVWDYSMSPIINDRGEQETIAWLEEIIEQQKGDTASADNVTVRKVIGKDSVGYRIDIADTSKRIIEGISMSSMAEVAAAKNDVLNYLEVYNYLDPNNFNVEVSTADAVQDTTDLHVDYNNPIETILNDYLTWYTKNESSWNLTLPSEKAYAIKDENGILHAANVTFRNPNEAVVNASYNLTITINNVERTYTLNIILYFTKDGEEFKLSKVDTSNAGRPTNVEDLQTEIEDVKTIYRAKVRYSILNLPLSKTGFTITSNSSNSVKLVYVDANEIDDFDDINDDGKTFNKSAFIKDMYGHEINISSKVTEADDNVENYLYNIDIANVENVIYNGQPQGPVVTHGGNVLQEGVDYILNWSYDIGKCKNVGPCSVQLVGQGKYTNWITVSYEILPNNTDPTITLSSDSFKYNGQEITPEVAIKVGDQELDPASYTVTYADGRRDVGEYEVSAVLNENYGGATTKTTFSINPKGTNIKAVTKSGKNLIVNWKKQNAKMSTSRITGYQIQIARNKTFTRGRKNINIKGFRNISKTIPKPVVNKKYFIRIRTYKNIDGKKLFSDWSRVRS